MRRGWLVAAALLPACSAGVVRPAPAPPLPRPPLTAPDPRGLSFLRPTSWHAAAYVDYRTVDVHWTAGAESCGGLAEVRVAETPDAVTITLLYGARVLPEGTACPAIGIFARTRVRLPHALDGRRLVDGADGATRPLR